MNNRYFSLLRRLWAHLSPRRRGQFVLLLGLSGISALAEMIGLGIVFPFLGVLISPEKVMAIPTISRGMAFLGLNTTNGLLVGLTALLVVATIAASAVKLLLSYTSAKISFLAAGDLNVDVFRRTLFQPYCVHISRNSSEIIAGINAKVSHAMLFIHQSITLLSSIIVLTALTVTLININLFATLSSLLCFGMAYLLISRLVKQRLRRNGKILSVEVPRTFKTLQEGLGGIRDVLLDRSQEYYCDIYAGSDRKIRRAQAANSFVNTSPRYLMEGFGITFIVILASWLTLKNDVGQDVLPVLGALALGAQRMLPALQAIYGAWANIVSSEASVLDAINLLDQPLPPEVLAPSTAPIQFSHAIELKAVDFSYHGGGTLVLQGVNLTIRKGDRIGIVGSTGSGKSTLLDILMGLLEPTHGCLSVDGKVISGENCFAWRQNIAHVPQSIFLADGTVAENIALGTPAEKINLDRVKEAARQARISDVVEARTEGYGTCVGERGVKLSGGQRQRIAVARALYKQATVLVLDEATSALDTTTEAEVMDAVRDLNPMLTIIMVAHRLTTVRNCDRIIRVEGGKIVASGTFDEVIAVPEFG